MSESELNNPENHSQEWQNCPKGAIGQVVGSMRHQTQIRTAKKWASVSALLLVLVAGGFLLFSQMGNSSNQKGPRIGKYCCSEVYGFMAQLLQGELDRAIVNDIRTHLRGCPHCQEALESQAELYRQEHGVEPKFKFNSEPFRARWSPYHEDNLLVVR